MVYDCSVIDTSRSAPRRTPPSPVLRTRHLSGRRGRSSVGGSRSSSGPYPPLTGERLVALLDGGPCSPELRRSLWACQGGGTKGKTKGPCRSRFSLPSTCRALSGALDLPGLTLPSGGTLGTFADRVLPVWGLLVAGEGSSPKLQAAIQDPILEVWGALGGEAATDPGCRTLTIPLLWLGPLSGVDSPVRPGGELTWKSARDAGTGWFVDHLQRAKGRDELAAWVLRRMPPVWRLPSPSLLEDGKLPLGLPWRAATEEERRAATRRPRVARPPGGGRA